MDSLIDFINIIARGWLIYSVANYFVMKKVNAKREQEFIEREMKRTQELLKPETLKLIDNEFSLILKEIEVKKKIGLDEHIRIIKLDILNHPRFIENLYLNRLTAVIIGIDKNNEYAKISFTI